MGCYGVREGCVVLSLEELDGAGLDLQGELVDLLLIDVLARLGRPQLGVEEEDEDEGRASARERDADRLHGVVAHQHHHGGSAQREKG